MSAALCVERGFWFATSEADRRGPPQLLIECPSFRAAQDAARALNRASRDARTALGAMGIAERRLACNGEPAEGLPDTVPADPQPWEEVAPDGTVTFHEFARAWRLFVKDKP